MLVFNSATPNQQIKLLKGGIELAHRVVNDVHFYPLSINWTTLYQSIRRANKLMQASSESKFRE